MLSLRLSLIPKVRLTLGELDELAEDLSEDEVPEQRAHQGHRHAEDAQQDVRDGQVEEEDVGDGAHATVLDQGEHHQQIAHDGAEQDGRVAGHHPDGHVGTDPRPARTRLHGSHLQLRLQVHLHVHLEAHVHLQAGVIEQIVAEDRGGVVAEPQDGIRADQRSQCQEHPAQD